MRRVVTPARGRKGKSAALSLQQAGSLGEADVVKRVECPNCGKPLVELPRNYPLYDVQCTGCIFRAQVKTATSSPQSTIYGAGWDILDKVLKSGFMIPPLLVNYRWPKPTFKNQVIRFYPFVPRHHVRMRQLPPSARRANYRLFNYVKLNDLPCMVLYDSREER